jgi:transposase
VVNQWLAESADKIEVFYLPSYSPELNPDELLNSDLKQ